MTATVNIREAKTHLSKLIERVRLGEEIIIAKAGTPVARLVPEKRREPRTPGSAKGKFWIANNFDDPLPDDLLDLFEARLMTRIEAPSSTFTPSSGGLPPIRACRRRRLVG